MGNGGVFARKRGPKGGGGALRGGGGGKGEGESRRSHFFTYIQYAWGGLGGGGNRPISVVELEKGKR